MKNKRVVVTGGVGFIGSNLAGNLAEGNEVVILDDLSTGRIDMKRHIPIARPITADEELKAIEEVLKSGMLAQGRAVSEFENLFSEYIGVKNATAVSNGTVALDVALKALEIREGDEVITTPFTFIATANSILYQKVKPIFADVEFTVGASKDGIKEVVSRLKRFKFVHPVILFGSRAKGTERAESDVDVCTIPKPEADVNLKERIALNNTVPESINISLLSELPVYIRKRVFLEGKVLYTEDPYYVLTLAKENDLEYARYQRMKTEYHKGVMKREIN